MIRIEGLALERVLNHILREGIRIWNVCRRERACLTLELRARDFHRLRPIAKQFHCRIHILERYGMPFVLARFRFRKVLVLGSLLGLIAILFAQTRVWIIEVNGCYRVQEATVYRALTDAGIVPGIARKPLDLPDIAQTVRAWDSGIAWAGVKLSGVVLSVEIVEADPIPEQEDKTIPADVVASKDAIVKQVTALSGKPAVKPGDAVRRGEILIRGDITKEEAEEPLLVHAEGDVLANVWYTSEVTLQNKEKQRVPSGKEQPYRALMLGKRILYQTDIPYRDYRIEIESETTLSGAILPLTHVTGTCTEMMQSEIAIDQEELSARTLYEAELQALSMVPKDANIIAKKNDTIGREDGSITGIVWIQTEEQIGQTKMME